MSLCFAFHEEEVFAFSNKMRRKFNLQVRGIIHHLATLTLQPCVLKRSSFLYAAATVKIWQKWPFHHVFIAYSQKWQKIGLFHRFLLKYKLTKALFKIPEHRITAKETLIFQNSQNDRLSPIFHFNKTQGTCWFSRKVFQKLFHHGKNDFEDPKEK